MLDNDASFHAGTVLNDRRRVGARGERACCLLGRDTVSNGRGNSNFSEISSDNSRGDWSDSVLEVEF